MKWHTLLVASLVSGGLFAQTPPSPGPGESKPKPKVDSKVDERADEMRQQIGKGRQVKSHVKVAARLKNGNKLIGVVKDGRLIERVDGLRFVDAQARDRGAGIRLWYSGGTRNYVFVPFFSLKSYEVLQRLSNKQLRALEQEMQMSERRADERAAAAKRKAAGKAEGGPPAVGDEAAKGDAGPGKPGEAKAGGDARKAEPTEADKAKEMQELRWAELLKTYPPAKGWNEAKKQEIMRRPVVVRAQPSALEKAFVEQFDDWMQACENAGIDPNAAVPKKDESKRERRRKERERLRGRRGAPK